jgi:uncharacterized membrane protein
MAGKSARAIVQTLSLYAATLFVAFSFLSSLWIASHRRFWYDEIFTMLIARLPDSATIWRALASAADTVPPLSFLLVRLFDRALGPPELAARIPSAVALALGLLITFDCVRRLTDNLHALASLALLSCSLLPYYGYEARPYALFFMLAAAQLWLWVHAPDNRKSSAVLFGAAFFLAFSVHYYTALCLIPYAVFEASQWKLWKAPSAKLLAAILGTLSGVAVFSRQILGARTISSGFWAHPTHNALLRIFAELFPFGLLAGAAALIFLAWTARPERTLVGPMLHSERLGWFFLLIPVVGYVAATFVTNAFYVRYFIGMLPGVAVAFACALWRRFHENPRLSVGIVLVMFFFGVSHQVYVTARPWTIEPPASEGQTARLRDALVWESIAAKDGKKNVAVPADLMLGVEARFYSQHPERYAFVVTPEIKGTNLRLIRNMAQYRPMRFWALEDLRAAARDTLLLDPNREMLKAMTDSGFRIKHLASDEVNMAYLE